MPDNIIRIENVSWTYARSSYKALCDINIQIRQGEFVIITGDNGAGKTSFCRLLNGLIPHSLPGMLEGTVYIDGVLTADSTVPRLALKTGMVFEDAVSQLFTARVDDEIAFALENLCMPPDLIREKVNRALEICGLNAFRDYAPSMLSGGQQQRLAIAAALAMASKILILDEAFSQIDPASERDILSLIHRLCKQNGLTVVLASNTVESAALYSDRIYVLENSSIKELEIEKQDNNCILLDTYNIHDIDTTDANEPAAIGINNLFFRYGCGPMILNGINLSVAENEFLVITGPNGCGKTTLLKIISGLLRPIQGSVQLRGRDTSDMDIPEIAGNIGFIMQNPDPQLFTSTVYDEAAFSLRRLLSKNEIKKKVEQALVMTGLSDKRDLFPPALSRADRVMTVFAAVLAMGPKIIMMDEPFAGQDKKGRELLTETLLQLHKTGYTLLIVTHNSGIISEYAQRIITW